MNRMHLAVWTLVFCGLSLSGSAQEGKATPVVTAAAPVEKVRFAGSLSAVQMRIEVRSAGGTLVYDSDWRDGNILDWLPRDTSGQPLAYGAYRLVMKSRNLGGQASEKQVALHVDANGMTVDDQPGASPTITFTGHDGETGQLITTSGDLSFRFGDFLNRKDIEAMRLTPTGELDVNGLVRAKGMMFPDGTILTTALGQATAGDGGGVMQQRPGARNGSSTANWVAGVRPPILPLNPPTSFAAHPTPRLNFAPAFQFVVSDTGVSVGTTNPAYRLDITGVVNTGSEYDIGGVRFAGSPGTGNTLLGKSAGNLTMTGVVNTATGYQALSSNTTGSANTASGASALNRNADGCCNTANGYFALANNTGENNTALGNGALQTNTTGSGNIGIGSGAGFNLTTGGGNIDIGNQGVAGESGAIRIGSSSTQTKVFIAGITSVTTGGAAVPVLVDGNGQLGTASSSRRYKFDISAMGDATAGLMRLRPVTFRYLAHGDNAPLQYGLIAEEVAEVYPEMVTRNSDGEVETVMYQFLAPMLLNEVQKEHRLIEEQQQTIDVLNAALARRAAEEQTEVAALRDQLKRLMERVEHLEGTRTASQ